MTLFQFFLLMGCARYVFSIIYQIKIQWRKFTWSKWWFLQKVSIEAAEKPSTTSDEHDQIEAHTGICMKCKRPPVNYETKDCTKIGWHVNHSPMTSKPTCTNAKIQNIIKVTATRESMRHIHTTCVSWIQPTRKFSIIHQRIAPMIIYQVAFTKFLGVFVWRQELSESFILLNGLVLSLELFQVPDSEFQAEETIKKYSLRNPIPSHFTHQKIIFLSHVQEQVGAGGHLMTSSLNCMISRIIW